MLLNIYLGTTIASVAVDFIKSLSTRKNLLDKGYEFSKTNRKVNLFSTIANMVVPGLNVYNAYKLLITDEKEVESELIKRGTIYKPQTQKTTEKIVIPTVSTEEQEEVTSFVTKEKTYDEMTIDEKREFLLKQRATLLSDLSKTDEEIDTLGRSR